MSQAACEIDAVEVTKTAETSFDRTYDWTIAKTGAQSSITLAPGQSYLMDYQVVVSTTGYTDDHFAVDGTIRVVNPASVNAILTGVTDVLDGLAIPVTCGVGFPLTLGPGGELLCSYESALPDATTRTNEAFAATAGIPVGAAGVGPGSGSATVDFAQAAVETVDECVEVTDSLAGSLGKVCVTGASKTLTYQLTIGPFEECGPQVVRNTASIVTNDRCVSASSSWSVDVEVVGCPTEEGCSLTPGYWKTHSTHGPAPYDDTWARLPDGADTLFGLSGQSYYQVLRQPARGNAYYILARQFIAAELNGLNGASLDVVAAEVASAEHLFATYGPTPAPDGALRARFLALATVLDDYNSGLIGPGHCADDLSSRE